MISYIILGICAGILAGMFGIGGGIVIVPALVLIFGMSLLAASGTSLAALLLPAGITALLQYKRAGLLNIKISAIVAFGIFCGSAIGANVALNIDNILLKQIYGLFLIWAGIKFARPLDLFQTNKKNKEPDKTREDYENLKLYIFFAVGIIAGIAAGMFGIGGGIVITAFLIGILKLPAKNAIAISLASLLLPVGLPGVISYYMKGYIEVLPAIMIAIGIELGSAFSANFAIKMKSDYIKRLYGCFIILIGIYFIIQKFLI